MKLDHASCLDLNLLIGLKKNALALDKPLDKPLDMRLPNQCRQCPTTSLLFIYFALVHLHNKLKYCIDKDSCAC
jgi:hypothetical protein